MADSHADDADYLAQRLIEWEEQIDAGESPTAEQMCHDRPHLVSILAVRIAALRAIDGRFGADVETSAVVHETPADVANDSATLHPSIETHSDYQIEKFHACGGRAQVYVGHDEVLARNVAVKSLRSAFVQDQRSQQRLLREAEITSTGAPRRGARVRCWERSRWSAILLHAADRRDDARRGDCSLSRATRCVEWCLADAF